jgi:hypothetical protein
MMAVTNNIYPYVSFHTLQMLWTISVPEKIHLKLKLFQPNIFLIIFCVYYFRGKYKEISKHLDWLQVSMATYQTLSNPIMHHCDEMISVEKGLLQSLVDPDGPGALSQVLQMIQKKKEKENTW